MKEMISCYLVKMFHVKHQWVVISLTDPMFHVKHWVSDFGLESNKKIILGLFNIVNINRGDCSKIPLNF